jgi:zinc transporter 1/2/3
MAQNSFKYRSLILLLLIAVFFVSVIQAQEHVHEGLINIPKYFSEFILILFFKFFLDGTVHGAEDAHAHEETAAETAAEATGHGHAHGSESCEVEPMLDYNLPMRIGSIFIIMATSAVGIFAPIILYRVKPQKDGSIRDWILTAGKFFGTGVIIATAFIHMLPEALERFGSECLGEGWHSYHAFGGLFCMLASFALQVIELAALSNLDAIARKNAEAAARSNQSLSTNAEESADGKLNEKGHSHIHETSHELNHHEHNHSGINEDGHVHSAGFLENEQQSIRHIGTLILEFGIVMHSIIIGITLGTTDNSAFNTLFIALIFHQFFEGIALGTRINDLQYKSWKKPIIMGLIFVCMTPIGISIGIGIRATVNPAASILAQAILDSLSAGILLYNAYVSLMSIEINHNAGFRQSPLIRKIYCFICMYLGAGLMAVLGTWA